MGQVQGDEMYIKTQYGTIWLATAISVFSRLLIWGAVSPERNSGLITQVVAKVKEAAMPMQPLLWATDGYSAWKGAIWTSSVCQCTRANQGVPDSSTGPTCTSPKSSNDELTNRSSRLSAVWSMAFSPRPRPSSLLLNVTSDASTPLMWSGSMPPFVHGCLPQLVVHGRLLLVVAVSKPLFSGPQLSTTSVVSMIRFRLHLLLPPVLPTHPGLLTNCCAFDPL